MQREQEGKGRGRGWRRSLTFAQPEHPVRTCTSGVAACKVLKAAKGGFRVSGLGFRV